MVRNRVDWLAMRLGKRELLFRSQKNLGLRKMANWYCLQLIAAAGVVWVAVTDSTSQCR